MDQQLDNYEKDIKTFIAKVKARIFVGLSTRTRGVFLFVLVVIAYVSARSAYYMTEYFYYEALLYFETHDTTFTLLLASLSDLLKALAFLAGVVLSLFGKKWGWIFICLFAFSSILSNMFSLFLAWKSGAFNPDRDPLMEQLDNLLVGPRVNSIFYILISLLLVGYLMSKPIEEYFKLGKKDWLKPAGIIGVLFLFELFVIATNFGF